MFPIWLDNSFIELPESNLKIWEKSRNYLTSINTPMQGKTNMNDNP